MTPSSDADGGADAPTALIVDEERAIVTVLRAGLEARGFAVHAVGTGARAIDVVAARTPDVVLLDLRLPDTDGLEVLRRLREWSDLPVLVLSADGHEHRKVEALDSGADDYVTKPFSMPELCARIRVAMRHHEARPDAPDQPTLQVGDLCIDVAHHTCHVGEDEIDLTPKEFRLLALLARWPGRVITHRLLLHEVWGPEYTRETQYLRTYATNLRRKLGSDDDDPRIVSEPGVGYRLVVPGVAVPA